jgi:hypothetical protein
MSNPRVRLGLIIAAVLIVIGGISPGVISPAMNRPTMRRLMGMSTPSAPECQAMS